MNRRAFLRTTALGLGSLAVLKQARAARPRPNILWIVAEDASPHIGCYGETAIKTPHLDALAAEGVRFENAVVTCPVCSPVRSALITGMYQTPIGSHNHRSQNDGKKAGGNKAYYDSYMLPEAVPLVSDLFRAAGYYACNGQGPAANKPGKTDYNFMTDHPPYDGKDWREAPEGKPFFAQIQLRGGKYRPKGTEVGDFELPPYYPDDPVLRKDWAEYLGSWEQQDREVGEIVESLKEAGVYENTLIVFLTDHGISHARGKQFLYEEGIRVPLIMRLPEGRLGGTVRKDLALQIDLAPASLGTAGIPVPEHVQGVDLFAPDYRERERVFAARDRCDETIETLRCVRTRRYKYIRNFQSYRPHLQRNQYKDGKAIVHRLRELYSEGNLTPLQASMFTAPRPPEELYDLDNDPYEIHNLADSADHADTLRDLRQTLYSWMLETHDPGLIPEPILEDWGREYGSKYAAMRTPEAAEAVRRSMAVIEAGERGDTEALRNALAAKCPCSRYWGAVWLGQLRDSAARAALETLTNDPVPTVRVAGHLAMCLLGEHDTHIPKLAALLATPNLIVGMYAMNAIEQTGVLNEAVRDAALKALENPCDGTQRYGKRLLAQCNEAGAA